MTASLTAVHAVYLMGVFAVVIAMALRANVVVPAMLASFAVALLYTGSLVPSVIAVFNASLVAAKELFAIFLVIAFMTSLLNALRGLGADQLMVRPFRRVITTGPVAYAVLAAVTYVISLFFWPTPAVPLVAATLLPAALVAGLSPLGAAVAIAIAGQGMALSSDYIIRVAPGISAKAAGIPEAAALVADKALVLSLVTGGIALALGYLAIRRQIQAPSQTNLDRWQAGESLGDSPAQPRADAMPESGAAGPSTSPPGRAEGRGAAAMPVVSSVWGGRLAVLTPLVFGALILFMLAPKLIPGLPELKGGDAAALVGGTAGLLMLVAAFAADGRQALHSAADHIVDGLVFAFRAMGTVLPIAGFFFLGAGEFSGAILGLAKGAAAPDLLFEVIKAGEHLIPQNPVVVAFAVLIVGMITGIDGSGFAGLPLTGALSGALGPVVGMEATTLAAVGQMGAVWTGGGTLIAWSSLIAVTGFCRVPVLEAVRVLFLPVCAGLMVSTLLAVVLW